MAETPDHQTHLKSLVEQQVTLSKEIESKRNLLLKVTGAIEYLSEIGVTLPKEEEATPEPEAPSEPEVVE
tara:strand:- start:1 stop:210 length:210 start_codon:yes stop_codon:yes gene_type:complete